MKRRSLFNIARLLLLLASLPLGAQLAHAGAGFGSSTNADGAPISVQTYYANSVSIPDATGQSQQFMRKFVDKLPGLTAANANNLGQYLPVATPEKWVNGNGVTTNDDYYEIGIVEYAEKMHTDLPKATTLRGYVQLETPGLVAAGKSQHFKLTNPDGSAIVNAAGNQVYSVEPPHYLGPLIVATRNTAVRIKYSNLLPKGGFSNGKRNGDLFLPVDKTLMGAGIGPDGVNSYTENRAEIHLHGGDNPWISDGTPHQWVTPAGENTPYTKGASYVNVPDMPDPGPGSGTLYYPNGDSARLMFYHDHASGLTRLNVYAGEAAGYLLTDPPNTGEHTLPLPADMIPLVIQERTFVPTDIATQDALWDTVHWGQPGDLWFPHVYERNQDPNSFDGTNPVGRWDYGPWFWPVFPVAFDLPTGAYGDVTTTPEAFGDTPIINGTPYPTLTVDPKAYRFRILNASNDRMVNLSLYKADPTVITDDGRINTEVAMVPSAPPTATSIPRACKAADPTDPATGLQVSAVAEVIGGVSVPAGTPCWPATWPTDGRDGGVPDPRAAGPKMLHLGTEAGITPNLTVIPANPTNYEYMRRSVTVLNVSDHALFLAPAERADIVVDFSQFAGQTLILFNDMAAPVPAFDARIDYYTGDPDQTASGGWFTTLAGYGPNTRTLMQITVTGTQNGTAYNDAALAAAVPAVFAATQPKPIVGEAAYNTALGTNYKNTYARIFTGSAIQHNFTFTAADTFNYYPENSTTLTTATPGQVVSVPVLNKAIQELFDPYGRMNATLGVEIPFTNSNVQTTVPLGYIDPATESISDGETQVWKITHNGVDTHPVHFHLVNVQVINRIGWDGTVKPPADDEIGWKETVRMNPLEDIIVIVRAKKPTLPGFGLPNSVRLLDPTQPAGVTTGFSNLDPATGNAFATPVTNVMTNFGWEYVWHCHILGHEENDFMRPFIFKVTETAPLAPANMSTAVTWPPQVIVKWTDQATNEYSYKIERATGNGAYALLANLLANATSYTDNNVAANTTYKYRVTAIGAGGASSNVVSALTPAVPVATGVTLVSNLASPQVTGASITFTAAGQGGTGVYQYQFVYRPNTTNTYTVVQAYGSSNTFVWNTTGLPAGAYTVGVYVRSLGSQTAFDARTFNGYTLASAAPASGVTVVSSVPTPQVVGTPVTFTATGQGGSGTYAYQFLVSTPANPNTYTVVQAYSSSNTFTWNTTNLPAGGYTIEVMVKNQGSTAAYDARTFSGFTVLASLPATGVTLTNSLPSPQLHGTSITFTAAGQGGSGVYQYQFVYRPNTTTTYTVVQAYSSSNTFVWNTAALPAGQYTIGVYVRNLGSNAAYEARTFNGFTLN